MERTYPNTAIKKISKDTLIYENEDGIEQAISLLTCRDNWYKRYYRKESLMDKIFRKRKKCNYVGDRFFGSNEAYLVFYSDIEIKFFFDLNKYLEFDDTCEVRHYFGHIKEQLRNVGWVTFDIG